MLISLTYGKGTGKTELSAFDAALWDAGIGDFNLITLSSVIPPDSRVEIRKLPRGKQRIGDSLKYAISYRKGNFGSIDCLIEKIQCEDKPACAIVAAVYKSEGW